MYMIVAFLNGIRETVNSTDDYIEALQLQREYSLSFGCAVEIVKY